MISIIVPVYNVEKYLGKCLSSILNQTFQDFEIILIDDSSQDLSLDICRKYAEKDSRITVIENKYNLGQVQSYLKGIHRAKGEFISFVDSDDWIAPTMIEKLYKALISENADISACGCWHVYPDKRRVEPKNIECIGRKIYDHFELIKDAREIHIAGNSIDTIIKLYRCNKIFRRNILLQNLSYLQNDVRVFEDNNLVIPCILDAKKIVYVNEPLYYYRRGNNSTMSMFDGEVLESSKKFLENQKYIFKTKGVAHDISSDAYVVLSYLINAILKSKLPYDKKVYYLEIVTPWIIEYNVPYRCIEKYGASKQFALIFRLIMKKWYMFSIIISTIYYWIKRR